MASSGFRHQLVLEDAKGAVRQPILGFDRHADVLWGPECRVLAVTNWHSSDGSQVLVLVPRSAAPVVDIRTLVLQRLGPLPSITGNHHVYFEASRWLSPGTLRVRAFGYGDVDPGGFEVFFDCDLDGTVRYATDT
ncbi:MAG TPA: hypothetical protein PLS53_11450 [Thermoanaerobaculaceae bacterium]|nr:hypothetical protein [Thermoanaerobaculaceae bacterium]